MLRTIFSSPITLLAMIIVWGIATLLLWLDPLQIKNPSKGDLVWSAIIAFCTMIVIIWVVDFLIFL